MANPQGTAFVAYASRDQANARLVLDAIRKANALTLPIRYVPWAFNDVSGKALTSPILEKIEDSAFIVADITYLNLNVIYEVGFAIGRSKRVFLTRRSKIKTDFDLAMAAGIFDTLGYFEYDAEEELQHRLEAHIDVTPLPLLRKLNRQALVYMVEPPTRTNASAILISRMKKAGFHQYRTFNEEEDTRLSALDAISKVDAASGIALLLQEEKVPGSDVHNIRTMFVAGLADGMGKPLLIIAAKAYTPPLDVKDVVKFYRQDVDIIESVAEIAPQIVAFASQDMAGSPQPENFLQSLDLGDPRAENEMTTLGKYYLRTTEYTRALNGDVNLVVGRKGSGKSALWVQVRNKTRDNKQNIVVDLKPDGYQLIKLKEDILIYLTVGAREHLVIAFWEYLILLEVAYKLLEKDQRAHRFDHTIHDAYIELKHAYYKPDFSSEGDFAERLMTLSQRLTEEYKARHGTHNAQRLTSAEVTELLYTHDLRELRRTVSKYLEHKQSVWILFDNLDRGWSTHGADVIDAVVLRCLVDAGRKLEREMRKDGHKFHCIVFVRNDVYEHLMRNSSDFGKEHRATLDWSESDQLREMLRLRLVSTLGKSVEKMSFDELWRRIFVYHYRGEETSQYIIDRTLMRPRNLLKIINACRGVAATSNRVIIEEEDIERGLRAYSDDLHSELGRELGEMLPEAKDLLYYFLDAKSVLSADELDLIIAESGIEDAKFPKVVEFLLYYGIIGIRVGGMDHYIFNVKYDLKMLQIRFKRDAKAMYVINPGFWPGLSIKPPDSQIVDEQSSLVPS